MPAFLAAKNLKPFIYDDLIASTKPILFPMAKRVLRDTTVDPLRVDFETALRAMLKTPPPPAGDPSTRKQKPAKAKKKRKAR